MSNKMLNNKPWLNRQFSDGDCFQFDINYLLEHLTFEDVVKSSTTSAYWKQRGNIQAANFLSWQQGKEARLEKVVDELRDLEKLDAIQLALHPKLEMYSVINGISRLRLYGAHHVLKINTRLYHGKDFNYTSSSMGFLVL
jgi:hypothetical protein